MFCREQVAQLRGIQSEIERRGAKVLVVGNGGPHFARAFVEERNVTFPVYVDPERVTYRAAGLKRGVGTVLRPGVVKNGLRALAGGHIQGAVRGDPWQQGGVFVFGPGNEEFLAHVSETPGDHPTSEQVLDALSAGEATTP